MVESNTNFSEFGWTTRVLFAVCVGASMTGVLWLVVRNTWVSVFVLGVCVGVAMLENWGLTEETRGLRYEIEERERDVIGLRVRMDEMAYTKSEVEYKRARLRVGTGRMSKSSIF